MKLYDLIIRKRAEIFCSIKDLILRNIHAIHSNFLDIEEDDQVYLGLKNSSNFVSDNEELLDDKLEKRIEQEILKRDYYLDRIAKFRDWTEIVLQNVESIMGTVNQEEVNYDFDLIPFNNVLNKVFPEYPGEDNKNIQEEETNTKIEIENQSDVLEWKKYQKNTYPESEIFKEFKNQPNKIEEESFGLNNQNNFEFEQKKITNKNRNYNFG